MKNNSYVIFIYEIMVHLILRRKTMKKLISLFLALLLAFSCFALAGNAFWGGAMPYYEVRSYNATDYVTKYVATKCVYKSSDGKSDSVSTNSYDENGRLVKSVNGEGKAAPSTAYSYNADGSIKKRAFKNSKAGYFETETFAYNSKGLLSKQTYKVTEGGSTSVGTTTYSYNSKGLLTKKAYATSDNSYTYSYNYGYDDSGNVSKIVYKSPGVKTQTTTYSYNSKNLLTEAVSKDDQTTVTKYTYDKKGNNTKVVCTSTDEYLSYTTTRTFDKNGNILTENKVDATGDTYKTTRTYDASGRLIKEVFKSESQYGYGSSYTWKIKYDSKGNIAKETFDDGDGVSTTTYTYKKLSKAFVEGNVRLEYASTTYNGKAKKPAVYVSGACNGADYRLEYSNNKKPGIATVKILFTSPDMGVITVNFEIKPAKATNLKVTAKTKSSLTLKWDKVVGAKKYIVYQAKSDGTYKKLATVTSNKATLKNLKAKTSYKLCIVAVTSGGLKSAYSAKLSAKTAS